MRLHEVEKGDGFFYRMLFGFISLVAGMRLPDAARIVMYHRDFYGQPMTAWTHAAMRGKSNWTVGERELMAAMIAKWNTCPFCVDAHGSIAALELGATPVQAALNDFQHTEISVKLKATLGFLKNLIQIPDQSSEADIQAAFNQNVTAEDLKDAIAVTALFSITVRCAKSFEFALLDSNDSARTAKRMLKQGYSSGQRKIVERPDHQAFAEALRKRIFENPGVTKPALRQAVAKRTTGSSPMEEPYDELASMMGNASYKMTDELIKKVVAKSGSEKAAFELIVTAAVASGLSVWDKGIDLLGKVQ